MQQADFKRKKYKSGAINRQKESTRLKSPLAMVKGFPKTHVFAAGALTLSLGLFLSLPSDNAEATHSNIQTLAIPALEELQETVIEEQVFTAPQIEEEVEVYSSAEKKVVEVKSGDNLSLIFARAGLNDRDVYEIVNSSKEGKRLKSLYPGHRLEFSIEDSKLQRLDYVKDKLNSFAFTRSDNGYDFSESSREPDIYLTTRSAVISNSLFEAGKEAHLNDKLVMELAGIFGWDIDFALDIRSGDNFKVVFEEQFLDGEKLGTGNILAAEFTNQSRTYRAVRYKDSNGNVQYYTPTGDTMRKEFLRTPIDFARISSHFNLNRKHPVLNRIRAHKGTDYAASRGTPIKSAGDGKVIFAGKKGGYGNVVIVQHGQTYKTLYAHISKFRRGIRSGVRVKQGQVIAYVGSTGLATGPHLHYEFYVNGVVRNPVTVKLPKAQSIPKSELQRFYQQTQPLLAELNPEDGTTDYASIGGAASNQL